MVNTKIILLIGLAVVGAIVSYAYLRRHSGAKNREDQFKMWVKDHKKTYGGDLNQRFKIWNHNVDVIEAMNAKAKTYTLAVNMFADLTDHEFAALHLGLDPEESRRRNTASLPTHDLPKEVNWTQTIPLAIKNQGHCGSCWAFSTIGAIEGLYAKTTGKYVRFSEQQLVDCIKTKETQGCNGGEMYEGFIHTRDFGIMTEAEYPYTAVDGKCKHDSTKTVKVNTNYTHVPENDVAQLKAASAQGIVSIAVHAGQPAFRFYQSGILGSECAGDRKTLDHGIILTGYHSDKNGGYWIVRNSWGETWGQGGYAKIAIKGGDGVCGINIDNAYPTA